MGIHHLLTDSQHDRDKNTHQCHILNFPVIKTPISDFHMAAVNFYMIMYMDILSFKIDNESSRAGYNSCKLNQCFRT